MKERKKERKNERKNEIVHNAVKVKRKLTLIFFCRFSCSDDDLLLPSHNCEKTI
jgi:hypothetical protein